MKRKLIVCIVTGTTFLCILGFLIGVVIYKSSLNVTKKEDVLFEEKFKNKNLEYDKDKYYSGYDGAIYPKDYSEVKKCDLKIGNTLIVKEGTYAPITKEYSEEVIGYLHSNNKEAVYTMALQGKIIPVEIGEKYTVEHVGWVEVKLKNSQTNQTIFIGLDMINYYFRNY